MDTVFQLKNLVETLQEITPFKAFFDVEKPSGFPRRIMDMTHASKTTGFVPQITLKQGLANTWNWYKENSEEHLKKQNYFK